MYYFSLDQSSSITGFSVWKNRELLEYGKVKLEGEFLDRVICVKNFMLDKIEEIKKLDNDVVIEVVLEEIQLQQNVDTFKKLAQLLGHLECTLIENKIKYHLVYSSEWKSYNKIIGKSRAEQKRNAQKFVLDTYGYKATQDEADAICIGRFISHSRMSW